jgi:hypothetical protein
MRVLFAICVSAALCLAAGCASRPAAFAPIAELTPETDFELSYSGGIGSRQAPTDLPSPETAEGEPGPIYTVEVRILSAGPEAARSMFGDRAIEIGASSLAAGEVTPELLAKATLLSAPRLSVYEKQRGHIAVINQVAYVSGFALSGENATRVADPVVDTANEGLLVNLHVTSADESKLILSVGITMSEVVKPVPVHRVKLYGAEMQIQTPVVYTQQMSAAGEISKDRVLVLTGMMGRNNEIYTVLISGKRADE